MTDNEIIKALECCNHNHTWRKECFDCEYATFEGNCGNELIKDALDLINRQRAEIEKLNGNMDSMVAEHQRLIKQAKSEAIREFAEKLKETLINTPFGVNCSGETNDYRNGCLRGLVEKQNNVLDVINTLVKEMVGEDNERENS